MTLDDYPIDRNLAAGGAASAGGGLDISTEGAASVEMNACRILGNRADYGGGIRVIPTDGAIPLQNCEVSGNAAEIRGGGILVRNGLGTVTADDCEFRQNEAIASRGGGLIVYACVVKLHSCHFYECAANVERGTGGGLCTEFGADVTLDRCAFLRSSAQAGGAIGIRFGTVHVLLLRCIIRLNDAEEEGGLFVEDGMVTMSLSLVEDNVASVSGANLLPLAGLHPPPPLGD